jgi:hypothetical protein
MKKHLIKNFFERRSNRREEEAQRRAILLEEVRKEAERLSRRPGLSEARAEAWVKDQEIIESLQRG